MLKRFLPALSGLLLGLGAAALPAAAHVVKAGDVLILHPWTRATAGTAGNGAVYVILRNTGAADDALLSASSPLAAKVELHTHLMDNGVMQMREVDSIPLAAGNQQELKPGGLHLMLLGLKQPLKIGERLPLTLVFRKAGTVSLEAIIQAPGAMSGPQNAEDMPADHSGMDHSKMDHGAMDHSKMDHGAMDHSGHGSAPPK